MRDSDAAPVDPPIPVPDVPGADATARGLPRRIDLTLRQRLIVDASAMADVALRTGIASLIECGDGARGARHRLATVGVSC